jgi:hypothetical protein
MQQTQRRPIVVMLGLNGRPVIAFSNPARAAEWLKTADNMASVQRVFRLPDGEVDAGEEGQDPARFLSRTQPPNGYSRSHGPPR